MSFQSRKRLFLAAAALVAAAVLMIGTFVALQVRSVVAGPDAAAPAAAPTPVGHNWTEVEGHGTGTGLWWLGTTSANALELWVNGARALRLEPNALSPNVIAGYSGNSVTAGAWGATISGGGGGGGFDQNTVTGKYGTIGGGQSNTASWYATVGGGYGNWAQGDHATVGGGLSNIAAGSYATVPGGASNVASGNYSFAAGYNAKAWNPGDFVWADSTGAAFAAGNDNVFQVRASGGVYFYSNAGSTMGAYMSAGGNAFEPMSDRNVKANFASVDGQDILNRLASIPVETWNLKSQDPSIRHMGPMAQDFSAAFGLGEDNLHISTVDADGVALAAIQGLYQLSQDQAARIQALEEENASQQGRLDDLEARVTALEGGAGVSGSSTAPLSSAMPAGWLLLGGLVVGGLVVVQRRRAGGRS
jgi:hypothetical protein